MQKPTVRPAQISSKSLVISVIIATCNRPDLAYRAVCRVLEQSLEATQVIVVNNGSSLKNQARYKELFSSIEHRIDYVDLCSQHSVGVGPSVARNIGLAYAKGDYVTFCDDDDEWTDEHYLSAISSVLSQCQPAILFADQQAMRADGSLQSEHWFTRAQLLAKAKPLDTEHFYNVMPQYFYEHGGFPHLNVTLYQTKLIQQVGGFCQGLDYEEDFELFHRFIGHVDNLMYYDRVVSRHHIPNPCLEENVTTQMSDCHKQLSRLYIFDKMLIENRDPRLLQFATTHGSYAAGRIAEWAMNQENYALAYRMAKQSLGWKLSAGMLKIWCQTVWRK